jgi:hypothetical protein
MASPGMASKVINFKVELNELLVSDHLPVEVWFSTNDATNNLDYSLGESAKRDFKKANWDQYRTILNNKLAELLLLVNQNHDIETVNRFFTDAMLDRNLFR